MKLAVLSESQADESTVRILVDAILGSATEIADLPPLRTRGWPQVLHVIPAVITHLHYRTDADAVVVVVDSDDSPVHDRSHEEDSIDEKCRVCTVTSRLSVVQSQLRKIPNRSALKTGIGLAVPAIEAWLGCGPNPLSEASLIQAPNAGTRQLKNQLKQQVYGTDRPSQTKMLQCAMEQSKRLAQDIETLEKLFPGFAILARDVRSW